MAAILDFSKFNFSDEEIRAVKELVFDEVIEAPEIALLHTIHPGVVYDREVGFIGKGSLIGVAGQGCDPQPQEWNIGTRVMKWEPKAWEFLVEQCAKDLETTAAIYSLKTGVDYFDFTSSDYMNIVIEVLVQSVKEFIVRLVWFNDVNAKNVAQGGQVTDGVAIKYFNIINGLFKQMEVQVTANPGQRVAISENTGANYVAQELSSENVLTYLKKLVYGADLNLRKNASGIIYCTQSFYDAYTQSLQGKSLESLLVNLTDGVKTVSYSGVPLLPIPTWDIIIRSYYNNGTKLVNPHRAVYSFKDVLAVGVDSESSFGDMDVWYNKDSRKVKLEGMGKADAKLANPVMFQIAI